MRQDQIDSIISEGKTDRLGETYKPAVLAGIFDMSPANIYQLQQRGIIPHSCNYREAIKSFLNYYKDKASRKSGSIAEIALVRRSEHDRVKTMLAWYNLKQERGEFIDREAFEDLVAPVFTSLKSELVALVRKYPDLQTEIDRILFGMSQQGAKMLSESTQQKDEYVQTEISVMDTMEQDVREKVAESIDDKEQAAADTLEQILSPDDEYD